MEKLIAWFDAERGRRLRLANELGIAPGNFSQWRNIPPERVGKISFITGIPREELRPDIFAEPAE